MTWAFWSLHSGACGTAVEPEENVTLPAVFLIVLAFLGAGCGSGGAARPPAEPTTAEHLEDLRQYRALQAHTRQTGAEVVRMLRGQQLTELQSRFSPALAAAVSTEAIRKVLSRPGWRARGGGRRGGRADGRSTFVPGGLATEWGHELAAGRLRRSRSNQSADDGGRGGAAGGGRRPGGAGHPAARGRVVAGDVGRAQPGRELSSLRSAPSASPSTSSSGGGAPPSRATAPATRTTGPGVGRSSPLSTAWWSPGRGASPTTGRETWGPTPALRATRPAITSS